MTIIREKKGTLFMQISQTQHKIHTGSCNSVTYPTTRTFKILDLNKTLDFDGWFYRGKWRFLMIWSLSSGFRKAFLNCLIKNSIGKKACGGDAVTPSPYL